MTQPLRLERIDSKKPSKAFYQVPFLIYADDPHWTPPLRMELEERLNPDKNPYFDHARIQYWVAWRGKTPVGRISAQIDDHAIRHLGENIGNFGFFECEDNIETATALLNAAETWLSSNGMEKIYGPYCVTLAEEPGILVDGFDKPAMMLMGHSRPFYAKLLETTGYAKVQDLYAYYRDIRESLMPPAICKMIARIKSQNRLKLRQINMKSYNEDLSIILDILNDAWQDNWGYVPMTDAELKYTADSLKMLIREDFVYIAELDGEPVGMMVTLPNINEISQKIGGKLFPFGWIKLLWWLKMSRFRTVRVPLMGVRRSIQNSPYGAAIAFMLIEAIRINAAGTGVPHAELSWILEDNTRMRSILERMDCEKYKTYRVFGKSLGSS